MVERVIERQVAPGVSRCANATTHNSKQFEKVVNNHWTSRQTVGVSSRFFFPTFFSERFVWELLHLWAPNQPPPPPPSSSSSSSSPQIRIQGDSWWQCFPWSLGGNFGNHRIFVSSSFAPGYDHLEQRNEFLPLAVGTEDVSRDVGSGSGSGCEAWHKKTTGGFKWRDHMGELSRKKLPFHPGGFYSNP